MISFKWRHFEKALILLAVRWYVAYSLSYRNLEEMMRERGVLVDHSTLNRWVVHYAPLMEKVFRQNHKRKIGSSWRMDETYIKVNSLIKNQFLYDDTFVMLVILIVISCTVNVFKTLMCLDDCS